MVWETYNSPLYKAVESFNSSPQPCEPKRGVLTEEPCERKPGTREPEHEHFTGKQFDRKPQNPPRKFPQSEPAQCGNPLQALLGDKDMLLIAALIIILIHEKADMKLIIALGLILIL